MQISGISGCAEREHAKDRVSWKQVTTMMTPKGEDKRSRRSFIFQLIVKKHNLHLGIKSYFNSVKSNSVKRHCNTEMNFRRIIIK